MLSHDAERVVNPWSRPGSDNLQDRLSGRRLELSISSDKNCNLPSVLQHFLWHVPPAVLPSWTQELCLVFLCTIFSPSSRKLFFSLSTFPFRNRAHRRLRTVLCSNSFLVISWRDQRSQSQTDSLAVVEKAQSYTQTKPHCQVNFIYKHTNSWMTVLKAPGPQAPNTSLTSITRTTVAIIMDASLPLLWRKNTAECELPMAKFWWSGILQHQASCWLHRSLAVQCPELLVQHSCVVTVLSWHDLMRIMIKFLPGKLTVFSRWEEEYFTRDVKTEGWEKTDPIFPLVWHPKAVSISYGKIMFFSIAVLHVLPITSQRWIPIRETSYLLPIPSCNCPSTVELDCPPPCHKSWHFLSWITAFRSCNHLWLIRSPYTTGMKSVFLCLFLFKRPGNLNVIWLQLFWSDIVWSIAHQVPSPEGFWKGNDVPDTRSVNNERDQPVKSYKQKTNWWNTWVMALYYLPWVRKIRKIEEVILLSLKKKSEASKGEKKLISAGSRETDLPGEQKCLPK